MFIKAGWGSLSLIVLLTSLAFLGLIGIDQPEQGIDWQLLQDSYFHSILWFSIKQATLSTLLAVVLAIPIARALYFLPLLPAKRSFLSLCLLCFVMPTLVLITGLLALLGRSGLISPYLGDDWNLYGLTGILIAHVYLNLPFAVRIILQQLQSIPDTSWRLASQLKLSPVQRFKLIEWPILQSPLLVLSGFIFVLCFNSFAVVLALGGGPAATTLEVAIYQALKYDFNISEALTLAWTQFGIAGLLFLVLSRGGQQNWLSVDTHSDRHRPRFTGIKGTAYTSIYWLSWLALLAPILALLPPLLTDSSAKLNWNALIAPALNSLLIAGAASVTASGLAYLALQPYRQQRLRNQKRAALTEWLATHALVAPAMVLSVGLYIFLLPLMDLDRWGMLWVWLLNAAVLVPFAVGQLKPRLQQYDQQYSRLSDALKLNPVERLRIEWPFVRSVFLSSFALLLLLAVGDVAIFSIFGHNDWQTLPWLIYGYAGTYRIAEASLASLVLLTGCIMVVWLFERIRSTGEQGC